MSTMPQQDIRVGAPSLWARQHADLIRPGATVLDIAAGDGRHALWAAELGARVTAIEVDATRIEAGRRGAEFLDLKTVAWVEASLETHPIPPASFDVVLIFNYLDRRRFPDFVAAVKPDGYLVAETFLVWQRALGWGPTRDEHLLAPGELWRLVQPLELVLGREGLEPAERGFKAVASVIAHRPA